MEVKRRTQAERTAATRGALVAAARRLFAERGYAAVGTPEIVQAAGVTRGAMYHQFADKAALFRAVAEAVEADLTQRLAAGVMAGGPAEPLAILHAVIDAWFDACDEPEIRRILLLDAPVVLGWEGVRDLAQEYGLGLTEQLLQAAMDAGELQALPTRPFAHVLLGALQEAALVVTDDPAARPDTARVLHALVDGLGAGHPDADAPDDVEAVIALERRLLEPSVRRDRAAVLALLHEDFAEVGASGRVWDREAIAAALERDPGGPIEAVDLAGAPLAPGVVLVTYRTVDPPSLRSSIWRRGPDGAWRVRHHQGTPADARRD